MSLNHERVQPILRVDVVKQVSPRRWLILRG